MERKYTVLIAEDENEIRRELMKIVDAAPKLRVVAAVADGRRVLEFLRRNPEPDILLTDIRMPGMDALDMLPELRKEHPELRVVILSGYNNFEYAQTAIRYGVSEYILKPVNPSACVATLEGVAENAANRGRPFELSVAVSRRGMFPPKRYARGEMYALRFGLYPYAPGGDSRSEERLCELLHKTGRGFSIGMRNGTYFLLPKDGHSNARKLYDDLCAQAGVQLTFASAEIREGEDLCTTADRLTARLRAALVPFRSSFVAGESESYARRNAPFHVLPVDNAFMMSARNRDIRGFESKLRARFAEALAAYTPADQLLRSTKYLYVCMAQHLFSTTNPKSAPLPYDWENKLNAAFSFSASPETLVDAVLAVFRELFLSQNVADKHESLMREVEAYINTHYTERITNQTLAKLFGFVPSYISHMFKEYKGVSPCDYLTQVRIDNACRIIRSETDLNFGELALNLGFTDSSYFSRIFKKEIGMTPSEYRASIKYTV